MDSYTRTEQYLNGILNGTDVPDPYTREEQLLYEIAKNGGGGGSDLPAVTSADNGKVLKVINGAWDKGEASGGGASVFTVNFAEKKDQPISVTDNAGNALSIADICDAVDEGQVVVGKFIDSVSGIPAYFTLIMSLNLSGASIAAFSCVAAQADSAVVTEFAGVNEGSGDEWQKISVTLAAAQS